MNQAPPPATLFQGQAQRRRGEPVADLQAQAPAVPPRSSNTALTGRREEMRAVENGTVRSTIWAIRPLAARNSMSKGKGVFFIHITCRATVGKAEQHAAVRGQVAPPHQAARPLVGGDRQFEVEMVAGGAAVDGRGDRRLAGPRGRPTDKPSKASSSPRQARPGRRSHAKTSATRRATAARTGPGRGGSTRVVNQWAGGLRPRE